MIVVTELSAMSVELVSDAVQTQVDRVASGGAVRYGLGVDHLNLHRHKAFRFDVAQLQSVHPAKELTFKQQALDRGGISSNQEAISDLSATVDLNFVGDVPVNKGGASAAGKVI